MFDHDGGSWWEQWDDPEQVTRKRKAQEMEQQHGEAHTIWWLQLQDLSVQVSRETHAHGVSFNSLTLPSWHVLLTDGQRKVHMVLTGLARGGERPTEGSSHGAVAAKEREAETSEVRPAIRP